jgi:predicted enzyme related to lactoylglutathione lyase
MTERQRVAGIGGVFFKAKDPKALAEWYREHLGVPTEPGSTYGMFEVLATGRDATGTPHATVWSVFPTNTEYFGTPTSPSMINYRVVDLDAMLAQLRAAGVWVDDKVMDEGYGRFGWGRDPEGNRFELWQPPLEDSPPA